MTQYSKMYKTKINYTIQENSKNSDCNNDHRISVLNTVSRDVDCVLSRNWMTKNDYHEKMCTLGSKMSHQCGIVH